MKCPYCGQEMIDIRDYCVNCGKKLKKEEKGISVGKLLVIFLIFILLLYKRVIYIFYTSHFTYPVFSLHILITYFTLISFGNV